MSDNETVGYGKPPKRSQFAKGQSGNPNGRPKGSKNFATTLSKELKVRVPITENGTHRKVSKQEAIAKQLVNKSAAGDARAMSMVLGEMRQMDGQPETGEGATVFATAPAQLVLQHMMERMMRTAKEASSEEVSIPCPSTEEEKK